MATKSIVRQMAKVKKVEDWFAAKAAYKGDNIDNVLVCVRLFQANPGQPQEMKIEVEPDSPAEAAILAVLDDIIAAKDARGDAILTENGLERTSKGIMVKGQPGNPNNPTS